MKTINKILFLLAGFLLITISLQAQVLLTENFNYDANSVLEGQGGWVFAAQSSNHITIYSNGLSYTGYVGSGIGRSAKFPNGTPGEVLRRYFTTVSTGKLYYSFLLDVKTLGSNATEGFVTGFSASTSANNTQFWVKKISSTTFHIGLKGKSGSSVIYSNNIYDINKAYLVVLKYTFTPNGTTNDTCSIFVFSSGV